MQIRNGVLRAPVSLAWPAQSGTVHIHLGHMLHSHWSSLSSRDLQVSEGLGVGCAAGESAGTNGGRFHECSSTRGPCCGKIDPLDRRIRDKMNVTLNTKDFMANFNDPTSIATPE